LQEVQITALMSLRRKRWRKCEGGNWRNTKILVGGEDLTNILSIRRVEASVEVNGLPQLTLFVIPWKNIVVEGEMRVAVRLDDDTPEWVLRALEWEIGRVRRNSKRDEV